MYSTKIISSQDSQQGDQLYQHAWNSKKGKIHSSYFLKLSKKYFSILRIVLYIKLSALKLVNKIFERENKNLENLEKEKNIRNRDFLRGLKEHHVMSTIELIIREILYFKIDKKDMLEYMEMRFRELGKVEEQLLALQ